MTVLGIIDKQSNMSITIEEFGTPSKSKTNTSGFNFSRKNRIVPWVEKYRPKKLKDVVHQPDVIRVLKNSIKTGNLPHLLFHGPPGTGKTSTILALARELFGPKLLKKRVFELNASSQRGINFVREDIFNFATSAVGAVDPRFPCPPYKIVILDEVDAMTKEAQSALRKIMEDASHITRFMFICNYINKIIDPIVSRCTKFRFKPLPSTTSFRRLQYISHRETMILKPSVYATIIKVSGGDMRKAIMLLQNISYTYKYTPLINDAHVYELANWIPPKYMNDMLEDCLTTSKPSVIWARDQTRDIRRNGFPVQQLMEQLLEVVVESARLTDIQKATVGINIAGIEKRLNDAADEYLQLMAIFTVLRSTIQGKTTVPRALHIM